jgi:HD superfamily phosphodiesterase
MTEKCELLDRVYLEMISYYEGDPMRIQHFIKVHSLSRLIGVMEGLTERQLTILEAAAYVHDIGIRAAERLYGKSTGKLQEKLGPELADKLLTKCGLDREATERVCYLVGHHHTYTDIDGADYQILVEADFLVNLYEEENDMDSIRAAYGNIFKTETGKKLCREMFGFEE